MKSVAVGSERTKESREGGKTAKRIKERVKECECWTKPADREKELLGAMSLLIETFKRINSTTIYPVHVLSPSIALSLSL